MNRRNIFVDFIVAETAKLLFRKLVPLSATMLFAATAYANCPSPHIILTKYVNNKGAFDDSATEWKLRFGYIGLVTTPAEYKDLQLIKISLTKNDDDHEKRDVTCVYNKVGGPTDDPNNDPNEPKNLYLKIDKKPIFGRENQGKLTLSDSTVSYVTVSKAVDPQLEKKWSRNYYDTTGKTYFCSRSNSDFLNQCGGFVFADGEMDQQDNKYWFALRSYCFNKPFWDGCSEIREPNYWRDMGNKVNNSAKPYCDESTCKREIAEMNALVSTMATYWNKCWKGDAWQGQLLDNATCVAPDTPTWPDYSGIK